GGDRPRRGVVGERAVRGAPRGRKRPAGVAARGAARVERRRLVVGRARERGPPLKHTPVRTVAALAMALGLAGCTKHEPAAAAKSANPPLPADVAGVQAVAPPTMP